MLSYFPENTILFCLVSHTLYLKSHLDMEITSKTNKIHQISRQREPQENNEVNSKMAREGGGQDSKKKIEQFSQSFQIKKNLQSPVKGIEVEVRFLNQWLNKFLKSSSTQANTLSKFSKIC